MSSARLTRLLKTKSALLSLITVAPLVVVILGLAACVKHPVGDPEKSQVDPQYAGVWTRQESQDEEQLLFIRPYDRRTYLIFFFEFHVATDVIEPRGQGCYKAWLASIGDAEFMTLEPISHAQLAGSDEKPLYFVMKTSMKNGSLQWRMVNGQFEPVKKAQSSRELEEVIAEHISSKALYEDIATFAWTKCDDQARITAVLEAFKYQE